MRKSNRSFQSEQEEAPLSLSPVNFFQIKVPCNRLEEGIFPVMTTKTKKKYLLPDLSKLCSDDDFAKVALGWSEKGIEAMVVVDQPFQDVSYPNFQDNDSVEFFIDTRDLKTTGYNTRFCHHFFFLPKSVDGVVAGECTRFRTEDSHQLCDPTLLRVETDFEKNRYSMNIFIPSECLNGYDPTQLQRMGFTYRINRPRWVSQHFSVVTEEFKLEEQPALWSTLELLS